MSDLVRTSARRLTGLVTAAIAVLMLPGVAAAQTLTVKGSLINGQNHTGTVASLEFQAWTLTVAAGDAIVLSIGEVGPTDTPFNPTIDLFTGTPGPGNGVLVATGGGALTGHIDAKAPVAGTYTVYVYSGVGQVQDAATGNYTLTLAQIPGTFVIPAGDEGGPMTNGANHPGYIFQGDQDPWTFTATAGDNLSLSIAKLPGAGADSNFAPWIRLYGPNGGDRLGQGFGQLGGQVDITAPTTGTYTVIVASADATYSATGSYLLTLAKSGAFVVPTNDEGGPMSNGVVYKGAITRADLDQWVFSATAGSTLTINVNNLGGDSIFRPWLRLYGPDDTRLSSIFATVQGESVQYGPVTAPMTGRYRVVVASADGPAQTHVAAGLYSIGATGIDAPPTVDLGDISVDFGPTYGLWVRANHAGPTPVWQEIHPASPTVMAQGDIDGTGMASLIVTFPGNGVWIWRSGAGWSQLHNVDANAIVTADMDGNGQEDIILSFPGAGIWVRYNNNNWVQLHYLSAAALAAGNIDGDRTRKTDLVVSFAGFGVWGLMNNASWAQLDARDATDIHTGDFDGNGQDDVVINIAGQGIWTRMNNAGAFTQLHNLNSTAIAIGDIDGDALHSKDIIISFASGGVWARLNNTSWQQIHPLNSPVLATVDLQMNAKTAVIMNFPGNGTWLWKNNATFELLHPLDVEGLAAARFDIN